jgi:predicted DNA-binding protein YlxM (UPF0122 family)
MIRMRRLPTDELKNRVQIVQDFMEMQLSSYDLETGIVQVQSLIGDKGYRKEAVSKDGYRYYALRNEATKKASTVYLHHIVMILADAEKYINQMSKGMTINHINGIKTDNSLNNLEYLSQQDNNTHAYVTGLIEERITEKAVDEAKVYSMLKAYHLADVSLEELSEAYDLTLNTVKRIVKGNIHRPMYMMFRNMNRESIIVRKTGANKLSKADVLQMLELYYHEKMTQTAIADLFNVGRTAVNNIVGGIRWSEVYEQFNRDKGQGVA